MSAFSPEQLDVLEQALDRLVTQFGPFDEAHKLSLAEALIRLGELEIWDADQLVERALRSVRG